MSAKAIVLLSGGLDSATALAVARDEGFEVCPLTFEYGQKHAVEVDAARQLAKRAELGDRHLVVSFDLSSLAISALTGNGEIPRDRKEVGEDIPPTYVPARNLIFLSCAAARAESLKCRDIFIGVSSIDYSGYPDCRPEFIESFQHTVNLATRTGVQGRELTVHAPFIRMSKAQVIKWGTKLGVDYSLTHSCYDPRADGGPCGRCDSCLLRARAFVEAGIIDPVG